MTFVGKELTAPMVQQEHFRLLVESVRDYAIFMLDSTGHVATWNAGAKAIKGYTSAEIIGKHISTFYTEGDRTAQKPKQLLEIAMSEGRVEDEGWRMRKDGTHFWADVVITALRDSTGALVGFGKVTRDLTRRKAAAEKLQQTEEMLAATLYSIGDGVLATDENACITVMNSVAERLTGWVESDALGRPVEEVFNIISEDTRAKAGSPVARVLTDGIIVGLANHTALIMRDGTERPIADSGAPIRDAEGKTRGAVLVFRDVTEERRAEEALRQSEERFRLMIASVHDYAIYMLDRDGKVATWNPGAERLKGYREDEILGAHFTRFFTPEDIEAGKPARELEKATRDGRFEDESWRVRKDGTRFWANVVISAVRDGSGRLRGFAKVTRDLTGQRKVEEERVRLAQAQEAVRLRDEFLSIASHELKTPLTALQLQLQGLFDRLSQDETIAPRIQKASRAGNRLADLIETLLDVSRIATGRMTLSLEKFDIVETAREIIESMREAARQAGSEVTFQADGGVVGIWDRLRLEQILTNLLANAFKHASGRPVLVKIHRDNAVAVLEVSDKGLGVQEEALPRIFGRFERATITGAGGLGLGLYVARQVAEAHGGSIEVKNVDGGGACFTVRLPLEPVKSAEEFDRV